jgi:cytochrome c oxidase subunit 2
MLEALRWLGLPVAASAHAAEVDQILVLVHWLMLALFAGWSVFFVYVLVRFRRRRNPQASYVGARGRFASAVEVGVLAVEIVLLAFFSIPFWSTNVDAQPPQAGAVEIRVVAGQFAWNVHYPGRDGQFGRTDITLVDPENPLGLDRRDPAARDDVTTINVMNLPVNRPVVIQLSSKDVIHSLGMPQMRVKQDAIPGIVQPVWFTPTETGRWEIACSQLCGLAHYRMKATYTIQTQEQFDAWLDEELAFLTGQ